MKRIFAAVLVAAACVVGSTPSFAVGGVVHLLARGGVGDGLGGGFVRNPTTLLGASPPPNPLANRKEMQTIVKVSSSKRNCGVSRIAPNSAMHFEEVHLRPTS